MPMKKWDFRDYMINPFQEDLQRLDTAYMGKKIVDFRNNGSGVEICIW